MDVYKNIIFYVLVRKIQSTCVFLWLYDELGLFFH